ncbi:carbonate dehydratase, partial [Merismopedia glauca CCAP 1448/3]
MKTAHSQKNFNFSRRNLIKLGAGAVGTGLVTVSLSSQKSDAQTEITPPKPTPIPQVETPVNTSEKQDATPDEALKILLEGNERFTGRKRKYPNQNITRLSQVAQKQTPFAAILGLSLIHI